jgi:hypothetical protein
MIINPKKVEELSEREIIKLNRKLGEQETERHHKLIMELKRKRQNEASN